MGSLAPTQFKCWEAKQVLDFCGTEKALKVFMTAFHSLEEVKYKSNDFFKSFLIRKEKTPRKLYTA